VSGFNLASNSLIGNITISSNSLADLPPIFSFFLDTVLAIPLSPPLKILKIDLDDVFLLIGDVDSRELSSLVDELYIGGTDWLLAAFADIIFAYAFSWFALPTLLSSFVNLSWSFLLPKHAAPTQQQ